MKVLGYSAYWHSNQTLLLDAAYKVKSEVVRQVQEGGEYGTGLDTLLVFYNFETKPDEFANTDYLKKRIEVQKYNSKERSIRVNVFVGFNEFTGKTQKEQIGFYYRTTMQALLMVKEKFAKRKNPQINFDFDKLLEDVKQGYLKVFPDL